MLNNQVYYQVMQSNLMSINLNLNFIKFKCY